ncbi:ABC transporter permease [Rhabdobacter roseus]|uniref:ABC-type antimicrobial peptide transport system permease subunit n=1 Tax=Rhabdobacter roseus TaxID=1655419 RepID=A0A840TQK1_9BACT|nr:ABC transporter permease [Rhabdobacter roseus]MBB5285604.1 ABC-type antimicrobial peptide transport system permease subunit [Rhabdobacter roseus]
MIKNYFKIAWRNLIRAKGYAFINIGGLAVGMACSLLILLWIQSEITYDMFHEKKDRLYLAMNRSTFDGKLQAWPSTPKPLGPALQKEYPEVAQTSRYSANNGSLLTVGDKKIRANSAFVDSTFLSMFTFPLLSGDAATALGQPGSIVITQQLAQKLFGNAEALGRTIRIDSSENALVTGVLADLPANSRFDFEYLSPWSYLQKLGWDDGYWGNNSVRTYVELLPTAREAVVAQKIKNITRRHSKNEEDNEVFLHALPKWRLFSRFENGQVAGGRIEVVRQFGIIAGFILLIACINFMNLSTARSEKRAKEVGVCKVAGARRQSLIGLFLSESFIITCLAALLALTIVVVSLPAFSELIDRPLTVDFTNVYFWLFISAFVVITALLAGSYPAFYLSSFQPVKVLKGTFKTARAVINPRKVLVVVQFSIALVLIVSTLVIKKQINYAQERDNGYQKNNLVYTFMEGDIAKNYAVIKSELARSGVVESVTKTSAPLTEGWSNSWGFDWTGKPDNAKIVFNRFCTDENIVNTAGLTLLEGRDMDLSKYPTDSSAVLLNESAVKAMGFTEPLGQVIKDNGREWRVVGIIKDFILNSPYDPMEPMVIEGAHGWFNVIHIKYRPEVPTQEALKATEQIFTKYNPSYPFNYRFVDESYAAKFKDEQRTGTLAALFAFLTVLISCLGLFGLAAYMAEKRTKEIGIRKVLGASIPSVAGLLSREFIGLVAFSCLVAFPVAWWSMNWWLQSYSYRTDISWWVFALAGGGALLITLLTVSSQAIKAALTNPVKALKTE